MLHFADVFKKSFLQGWTVQGIHSSQIAATLLVTAIIALYIFFVYRMVTKKTFYNKNFGLSLVCVSLITAGIILCIQTNIVLSLGMVGALSIVRFRTAVKDPMDLAFLFWSISIGIICGAHIYKCAVVMSVILTLIIVGVEYIPMVKAPMILVVNSDNVNVEDDLLLLLKSECKYANVKARNRSRDSVELTIELRTDKGGELVNKVSGLAGITNACLLAHDGEVTY